MFWSVLAGHITWVPRPPPPPPSQPLPPPFGALLAGYPHYEAPCYADYQSTPDVGFLDESRRRAPPAE